MENLVADELALGVEPFQLRCQDAGAAQVGRGQELDRDVGVRQPAQSVEARAEDVADVLFGEPGGVEFGGFHHDLQAQALGVTQASQATLQQVARVAGLHGQIGHDAQRDQVEVLSDSLWPAGLFVECFGQLVGHADPGQGAEGM